MRERAADIAERESAAAAAATGDVGSAEKRRYVRRIFSEIAPRYDLINHVLSANVDRAWRRRAIAALQWRDRPTGVYADLCAGTLDVGARLVREHGFGGFVLGADFAEPMLRAGRGKAPPGTLAPVVADVLHLPVREGSLSGAIVAFGIRNVAGLDAALREVRRALAPGARFVILEFSTPRAAPVRALYHFYFHRVLPVVGRAVSGHPTAYSYLPRSVSSFPAEEELASRMTRAGFRDVTWRSLTLGIAAIHVGTR
ncbi:MAG TPA: ubiquinone/menaquinone biosynthesis methyltransferase [Gemmatimonadaceae bacterium]|nr:ubiquinone/menaquinone biosynthesis methyltransferase [Gemmatimonadaceae bacterium]